MLQIIAEKSIFISQILITQIIHDHFIFYILFAQREENPLLQFHNQESEFV